MSTTTTVEQDLRRTCVRLLEEWALMMVDEAEASTDIFESEAPFFLVTVQFQGVFKGLFRIVCQRPFADALLQNLVGENEGDDSIKDALKEMGNVFAGNLLTEGYGTDLVFDLSAPQCEEVSLSYLQNFFSRRTFVFLGDDAPVMINISEVQER